MSIASFVQDLRYTLRILRRDSGFAIFAIVIAGLSRSLSGLLVGITSTDPLTFVVMLLVLAAVATLAGYLPARRASRIDPLTALRVE